MPTFQELILSQLRSEQLFEADGLSPNGERTGGAVWTEERRFTGGNYTGRTGETPAGDEYNVRTPILWSALNTSAGFTIDLIAKMTNNDDTRPLLGSDQDGRLYNLYVSSDGLSMWFWLGGGTTGTNRQTWTIAGAFADGAEHKVKVTWDGGTSFELFIDDVSFGAKAMTSPFTGTVPGTSVIWLGRTTVTAPTTYEYWMGTLRKVYFLSGATQLGVYLHNQHASGTINDFSKQGNDGTLYAADVIANAAQITEFWSLN